MGQASSTAQVAAIQGATYMGCYTDLQGALNGQRALPEAYLSSDNMTPIKCATAMAAYTYWGLEYANECWGANAITTGSVLAPAADCNFACSGASTEQCGAGNRLNLYQNTPASQCASAVTVTAPGSTVTQNITMAAVTTSVTYTQNITMPASTTTTTITQPATTVTTTVTTTPTPLSYYVQLSTGGYFDRQSDSLTISSTPNTKFQFPAIGLVTASNATDPATGTNYGGLASLGFDGGSLVVACSLDAAGTDASSLSCSIPGYGGLQMCTVTQNGSTGSPRLFAVSSAGVQNFPGVSVSCTGFTLTAILAS